MKWKVANIENGKKNSFDRTGQLNWFEKLKYKDKDMDESMKFLDNTE